MADNFAYTPGTGETGGADDIGGVKYPRVKLIHGADGTNDGDVSTANGLPVQGTVTANLGATDNAVLDAAVADLDIIAGDTTSIDGKITACNTGDVTIGAAIPAGNNLIGKVGIDQTTDGTTNKVSLGADVVAVDATGQGDVPITLDGETVTVDLGANNDVTVTSGAITETNSNAIKTAVELIDNAIAGTEMQVDVVAALPAGTNAIGKLAANSGVDIGNTDLVAHTGGGGHDTYRSVDLDETEEEIKATAGAIYGYYFYNAAATARYIKIYDDTVANVVVGTTVPKLTIPIPAGSAANVSFPHGIPFATAITIAATTGVADNDTGAPSLNDVVANIYYK